VSDRSGIFMRRLLPINVTYVESATRRLTVLIAHRHAAL